MNPKCPAAVATFFLLSLAGPSTRAGAADATGPLASFSRSTFAGRVQELRATDDYLVVHFVDGLTHKVACLREPDATLLWEKTYRSMSNPRGLHVFGDRVAVVAAEGDPAKTVGLHVYHAAAGAEVAYFRDDIFTALGSHVVGGSGASGEILDLAAGTKVFTDTPQRRTRLKAMIGPQVLYLVSEGAGSRAWRPRLVSLPGVSQAWQEKSFAADVLAFLDREVSASDKIVRDGFPTLFAGEPRSRPAGPFPLLVLDADGGGRMLTPADLDVPEPAHSVAVNFCHAWQSDSLRGLVAGLDTGHLRSSGGKELVVVAMDASGARLGRTAFSLQDYRLLWSGHAPPHGLLLLLHRLRAKPSYALVSYRLPNLSRVYEKEIPFLRATPGPGRLIGAETFFVGATAAHEATVFSQRATDGGLAAFYPFPERPLFVQQSPEDVFGVFNARHLFVTLSNRENPRLATIYRIPRGQPGWFDGSLSVSSPVYTSTDVNVSYAPAYGVLSVSAGSVSGSVWTTPAEPGTCTITLSVGTAVRPCRVEVVRRPPNIPPTASFTLLDPPEATFWQSLAHYDASASRDPDGRIVEYAWDFGDSIRVEGADRVRVSHFSAAGTYDVTLSVTDDKGATGKQTRRVVLGRSLSYRNPWHVGVGIPPALASGKSAKYRIEVRTGGQGAAATHANVYLALYGPKDAQGMRSGSGEFPLTAATAPLGTVPFQRNGVDVFSVAPPGNLPGIPQGWSLDDVEYLTLRHDNAGDEPGWYCCGIRVTHEESGKQWVFVPDQWLAFDEKPHARTWEKLVPVDESYPGGIYFGGGGGPRSEGLVRASDNIFILPAAMTKFYFTMLDRGRYLGVSRDVGLVGGVSGGGTGTLDPKFLRKSEWGIVCQAASIVRPTKFDVTLGSGGDAKKGLVWVFPSSWSDHPELARKAALVLPMKGNLDAFDYAAKMRSKLSGETVNASAALAPIVNYGAQALTIFGDVPDLTLRGYALAGATQYVDVRLAMIAARLGIELTSALTASIKDLIMSIQKALEWASGMGSAIDRALGVTYAPTLLQNMAMGKVREKGSVGNPSFLIAVDMFRVLKGKMETLITAAEGNDLAAFQTGLAAVEGIVLGNTARLTPQQIQAAGNATDYYITYADYGIAHFDSQVKQGFPLLLELAFEFRTIEMVWKPRTDYAHHFYDPDQLYNLETELSDDAKKNVTVAAMEIYGPVIQDFLKIAGVLAEICLIP